ncbi:hypothetical protein [Bathymodiolus heckerae thiotrophic gill symbiont]|uniref:hypothetical protein n=1 Tax=Bathymodiolus heckerae thiotrophic gill symbiont TaxID=1052212 RepID=UPI001BB2CA78|nr:hypothetical protein [Bathymodiolus heckerae thiotrophic gill symbiont]
MSVKFLADKQFLVAILAAFVVWLLFYLFGGGLSAKNEFDPNLCYFSLSYH